VRSKGVVPKVKAGIFGSPTGFFVHAEFPSPDKSKASSEIPSFFHGSDFVFSKSDAVRALFFKQTFF